MKFSKTDRAREVYCGISLKIFCVMLQLEAGRFIVVVNAPAEILVNGELSTCEMYSGMVRKEN